MKSAAAALWILSACVTRDFDAFNPATYFPLESAGSPVTVLPLDSPGNVLENLKTSYNRRRYEIYETLLHPGYRFYMDIRYFGEFNAGGGAPPDPSYWTPELDTNGAVTAYYQTRDQDLRAVRNMFDRNGRARDLSLFFTALPFSAAAPDTARYLLTNIELRVTLRDEPVTHEALGEAEVTLARGADGLWRLFRWRDRTNL